MRILLVDDDAELVKSLVSFLNQEDYFIDWAKTIKDGFILATTRNFDCIILDVNLPDGNGFNLCRNLRENEVCSPIIFLTVNANVDYKIRGLDFGGDDYLTKPFLPNELSARIRSLIRRYSSKPGQKYKINNLQFDPQKRLVYLSDKKVKLTKMESVILELLIRFQNRPLARDEILDHIYGDEYPFNNSVDVLVNRLRKKIGLKSKPSIVSVRGTGYMLSTKD